MHAEDKSSETCFGPYARAERVTWASLKAQLMFRAKRDSGEIDLVPKINNSFEDPPDNVPANDGGKRIARFECTVFLQSASILEEMPLI